MRKRALISASIVIALVLLLILPRSTYASAESVFKMLELLDNLKSISEAGGDVSKNISGALPKDIREITDKYVRGTKIVIRVSAIAEGKGDKPDIDEPFRLANEGKSPMSFYGNMIFFDEIEVNDLGLASKHPEIEFPKDWAPVRLGPGRDLIPVPRGKRIVDNVYIRIVGTGETAKLKELMIVPANHDMYKGDTFQFKLKGTYIDGIEDDIPPGAATWSVVTRTRTFDGKPYESGSVQAGTFQAKEIGRVTIQASIKRPGEEEIRASASILVKEKKFLDLKVFDDNCRSEALIDALNGEQSRGPKDSSDWVSLEKLKNTALQMKKELDAFIGSIRSRLNVAKQLGNRRLASIS